MSDPRNGGQRPSLPAPIEIAKFWKNRARNESLHVSLSEYEGHCLINVRIYSTGTDGIDRPTPKGVAMSIAKLPELAKAINAALDKAQLLGLVKSDAP
ncbi:hypothetical protein BSZ19_47085 [Bradyrhizobium japonicum]|uniref:Transcriptional coactivator p15 (PC4) C-terminal domain-containing protein n=1 Tax=Bradyrhizobium japonicum TaxID=375 RepID=A0A1Y2J7P9_BRAJP|nr:transcriptional coactivator p15/PC4 family protein [Bradyrhizobium japonicum]OSJ22157.1 hypothetical protein BSZ19_47085 [Bradyrhizobium japonicum]